MNRDVVPFMAELTPRPHGCFFPAMAWIGAKLYAREADKLRHPRVPVTRTPLGTVTVPFRLQPVRTHFLFHSSSSTLYSRLHEKCRTHEITLQGPLLGCLLLAVHHLYPTKSKGGNHLVSYAISIPVDMRSRLPHSLLSTKSVGFYVGLCDVKLNKSRALASTPFWAFARKCTNATNKCLANDSLSMSLHCFNSVLANERKYNRMCERYPNGHSSEISLSNIGKYPFPCDYDHGRLRLRGVHAVNSSSVYYSTAVFVVTCAGNEQLDLSLSHSMEKEKARELLDLYVRLVDVCADASGTTTLQDLIGMAAF